MSEHRQWVDFRVVKEAVTMEMLLDHYGINWLRKKGPELRGRCPIHKGEGDRTFHVNIEKGAFNCFSCHKRGNVLDFVAAMENCTVRDAALRIADWFKIASAPEVGESPRDHSCAAPAHAKAAPPKMQQLSAPKAGPINPPLSFQLRVDSGHEYGLGRGLTPETLELFGAGLCLSKGTFAGRFVIPLHNEQGSLVGYAGRSLDESEPKYLFPSSDKGFYKSQLLFNLHRVIASTSAPTAVVVVEGFFDTIKVHQAGLPCVGLFGSWLSREQEELLVAHFSHVILMLDGNDAGRAGTADALPRLALRLFVRTVVLPEGAEPDLLDPEDIPWWCGSVQ
jgi:DNA primase